MTATFHEEQTAETDAADLSVRPILRSHREEPPSNPHDFTVHVDVDPDRGPHLLTQLNHAVEIEGPATDLTITTPRSIDMSSARSIAGQILSSDMTDGEKAMRICAFVGAAATGGSMRQPIRPGDVVMDRLRSQGLGVCGFHRELFSTLCSAAGLENRRWSLNAPSDREPPTGHSANEVFYDGAWHFFDPSYRAFYLARDNTTVAGVEELAADPDLIQRCPHGLWYANTFWQTSMAAPPLRLHQYYIAYFTSPDTNRAMSSLSPGPHEAASLNLRDGETLRITWSNPGGGALNNAANWRLANRSPYPTDGSAQYIAARGEFSYTAAWTPGRRPPDALDGDGLEGVVDDDGRTVLRMTRRATDATIVHDLTSPYLLTHAVTTFRPALTHHDDTCRVEISIDRGGTWCEVWSGRGPDAARTQSIDVSERVRGGRGCRLRFRFSRSARRWRRGSPVGLDDLHIMRAVQVNPLALPVLTPGDNPVSCRSADGHPGPRAITHTWVRDTQIAFAPRHPTWGDVVRITGSVTNRGTRVARDVRVRFYDGASSSANQIGSEQRIAAIDPGGTARPAVDWDTTGRIGTHDIAMHVRWTDDDGSNPRTHERTTHNLITVVYGPCLTFDPTFVQFEDAGIRATICNRGDATATDVSVRFIEGDPGAGGRQIGVTQPIARIPPGDHAHATVDWTPRNGARIHVQIRCGDLAWTARRTYGEDPTETDMLDVADAERGGAGMAWTSPDSPDAEQTDLAPHLNDGRPDTAWSPSPHSHPPLAFGIRWSEPRTIDRVAVTYADLDSSVVRGVELQVLDDHAQWRTVADDLFNHGMHITHRFDPVTTAGVRLLVRESTRGGVLAVHWFGAFFDGGGGPRRINATAD